MTQMMKGREGQTQMKERESQMKREDIDDEEER